MTKKEIRDAIRDGRSGTLLKMAEIMENMAECHIKIAEQKQQKNALKEIKDDKKEYEKIAKEYYEEYIASQDIKEKMQKSLNEKEEKLKKYLSSCKEKKHIDEHDGFSLEYVQIEKPVYSAHTLEKKLPVHISREVVKKKLYITDEILFVCLMKRCGVQGEDLKDCVVLSREVDEVALEKAIFDGDIDAGMIDGTFVVQKQKEYIKVSKK